MSQRRYLCQIVNDAKKKVRAENQMTPQIEKVLLKLDFMKDLIKEGDVQTVVGLVTAIAITAEIRIIEEH